MRKRICLILALLLALPVFSARAEAAVTISPGAVALGGQARIEADAPGAVEYAYGATLNGQTVFEGEFVPQSSGWFRPREAGVYTLTVTARDAAGNTWTASDTLNVTGTPVCQAVPDRAAAAAGETVRITLSAQGGTGDYRYGLSVYRGNERIAHLTGSDPELLYAPAQEGELLLIGEAADSQGNLARSEPWPLTVLPGAGRGITGETGAFPIQGGYKTWIVHAPGIWTAESDSDFIRLSADCGADGGALTVQVLPGEDTSRRGNVTITCGALSASFPVVQSAESGEEEEISFEAAAAYVLADGKPWAAWEDAAGERQFSVAASGDWQAACDAGFITLIQGKNTLTVQADENMGGVAREAEIVLTCGGETAKIYVSQPGKRPGSDVLEASLSQDRGTAWQDAVAVRVLTTPETDRLILRFDGAQEPMVFSRDAAAETADGLLWQADILLSGEGRQRWLFTAENDGGSGVPALTEIDVIPEAAAIVADSARLERGEKENRLTLRATASADSVTLLGADGGIIGVFSAENASIDRCADAAGRYADWEIILPPDALPAMAALGDQKAAISQHAAEKAFSLYSQQDGWWLDKKYRHSNLQQSGCAIFALSHALQLLGYTQKEILPENLATTYASCLMEGGTVNDALVGRAGDDLGFKTRYELYGNLGEIVRKMEEQGAVFSFSVVSGHIAMVAAVTPDHQKFKIIDSAPSATFERIKGGQLYIETESGFRPIASLDEIPGIRYYVESGGYGGAEYWLDADYVVKRGVRLIQPVAK